MSLNEINKDINRLQSNLYSNGATRGIALSVKGVVDAIQLDIAAHPEIADEKRASVLMQLGAVLEGIHPNSKTIDVQRAIGHLKARVTTLRYIYDTSIVNVMARHRRSVAAERARDEEKEPEYINDVEGEFGIQIHGDPGEAHILVLRKALQGILPEEGDILDVIPSINFSQNGDDGEAAHVNSDTLALTIEVEKAGTRISYSDILPHEIAHLKEALILLVERRNGVDTMDKALATLKDKEEAHFQPSPPEDHSQKVRELAKKYSLTETQASVLERALWLVPSLPGYFDLLQSSDQLERYMGFLAVAIAKAEGFMPDPKKPWGMDDMVSVYEKISVAWNGGAAPIDFLLSDEAAQFFVFFPPSNDLDWNAVTAEVASRHIRDSLRRHREAGLTERAYRTRHLLKQYGLDEYKNLAEFFVEFADADEEKMALWVSMGKERLRWWDERLFWSSTKKAMASLSPSQIEAIGVLDEEVFNRNDLGNVVKILPSLPDEHLRELTSLAPKAAADYIGIISGRVSPQDLSPADFQAYLSGDKKQFEKMRAYLVKEIETRIRGERAKPIHDRFIKLVDRLLREGTPVWPGRDSLSSMEWIVADRPEVPDEMLLYGLRYKGPKNNFDLVSWVMRISDDERVKAFVTSHYRELSESAWGEESEDLGQWVVHGSLSEEEALALTRSALLPEELAALEFNEIRATGLRRWAASKGDSAGLALKVAGLYDMSSEDYQVEREAFLNAVRSKKRGELEEAALEFLEGYAARETKKHAAENYDLTTDGFVSDYGQKESNYRAEVEGQMRIVRLGAAFGALQPSHKIIIRTVAEKLSRLTRGPRTQPPIDFQRAPIKDVINYVEDILNHPKGVDIETNLSAELPAAALLLSGYRTFGSTAIESTGLFSVDPSGLLRRMLGSEEVRRIVKEEDPLTLGAIATLVDSKLIMGEPVVGVRKLPEELSTLVEFYRHDPAYFRKEVFEKDKAGRYLHPKTVAKVSLCQEYGLLPTVL